MIAAKSTLPEGLLSKFKIMNQKIAPRPATTAAEIKIRLTPGTTRYGITEFPARVGEGSHEIPWKAVDRFHPSSGQFYPSRSAVTITRCNI